VKAFAALLDGLVFMPSRNGKLRLLQAYFSEVGDPDRGYALAALTGGLGLGAAKPALIHGLVESRVDPALFRWSYDFVGDLAETVSLIWPGSAGADSPPRVAAVVETLAAAGRSQVPGLVERWLDQLDPPGRYALLKLITGGLRVGVSNRLAKLALAGYGGKSVDQIEELWHGLEPPFSDLFAWLDGKAPVPDVSDRITFKPLMLANPLDAAELAEMQPDAYVAEWKWDGIRVQLAARNGRGRVFSRTGDEIGSAFPDIAESLTFDAVLDGELLVKRNTEVASFNDLQQRLGRKTVSAKMLQTYPAHVRLYDILFEDGEDLRGLTYEDRRTRLEAWHERVAPPRMDLSARIEFEDWAALAGLRDGARAVGIEGLMLKRRDSPYLAGRPKGPWFKWKRDALLADCVVMYAQRGHGRRSSCYSDYTFGCWQPAADGDWELVPVGKAYFGFTDDELMQLDRWVRSNTIDRYGPVRAVTPKLVFEVAFDSVHRSSRHKSGLAMRFPRIHRIRWDKPAAEADRVNTLLAMIE